MNRRPLILILVQGLFLVLLLLLSNLVAAQLDIKNYYPIPKAIKMESNEVMDIPSYFDVSECVSGDCNNGEGVWLRMYADKEQTGSSSDGFAFTTVYYFIYKGTFSNNGTALKGKQISGGMRFTKDDNSKKVEPAKKIDLDQLAQEMAAVDFEGIYEGYTIKDKTYYRRKEGFVSTVSWRKNRYQIKSEYVWYTEGKERMAEVIYEVSDKISYQKIQGIRNLDQEFLIGKVDYTDGSEYIGFLYNGKRQGSGVFKDGLNPAQEGIWIDNVFSYKMDITIPDFTYDPNVKEEFNPATLLDNGNAIAGKSYVDPATQITFFTTENKKLFYHGYLTNQVPDGVGCYVNLQSKPDKKWATFIATPQLYKTGIFNNGELTEGIIISQNFEKSIYDGRDADKLGSIFIRKGSFTNEKLEGCGSAAYTQTGRYTYEEGEFKGGNITGWFLEIYNDTGSFTNRKGITHPLFKSPYTDALYEELMKTNASPCIADQMGGDVKQFVINLKEQKTYQKNESYISSFQPIQFSGVRFTDKKVRIANLTKSYGQKIYVAKTQQALYLNSYDATTQTLKLQGKVISKTTGKDEFVSILVPLREPVYLMDIIVEENPLTSCPTCLGTGTVSGRRVELIRKKGLRGSIEIGVIYGYRDPVTGEPYHLEHEKVFYSETCFTCKGKGTFENKKFKNAYQLIKITE